MKKTYTETFKYGKLMRSRMVRIANSCLSKPYKPVFEKTFVKGAEEPYQLTYSFVRR